MLNRSKSERAKRSELVSKYIDRSKSYKTEGHARNAAKNKYGTKGVVYRYNISYYPGKRSNNEYLKSMIV